MSMDDTTARSIVKWLWRRSKSAGVASSWGDRVLRDAAQELNELIASEGGRAADLPRLAANAGPDARGAERTTP